MGLRVGLTGGVGSGKSTVARLLAAHGALVVDADAIAREVVEPGTPGLAAVVARFGDRVLAADGSLDRAALASVVFADPDERAALNAIVHPLVGRRTAELTAAAPADAIVVHDIPLLAENDLARGFEVVVVVEAPTDVRIARLAGRGMSEADARSRMSAQAPDEQRRAIADEVIMNAGDLDSLAADVAALWQRLGARAANGRGGVERGGPIG